MNSPCSRHRHFRYSHDMSGIWRGGLPWLALLLVGGGQMCWSRVDVKASMTSAREGRIPSRARYDVDPLRYRDRGAVTRRADIEGTRRCVLRVDVRGPTGRRV